MLELNGISKRFGKTSAVSDASLSIPAEHTTVLIGPSGCGKSTVLRIILGLISPDSGIVLFEGAPVTPSSVLRQRQRMGYVIQDGGLFPHLTARGNIGLMAQYLGWKPEQLDARISELVNLTRFPPDGLERYPMQLSGGQRQRVSLMRSLMLDPAVILLDEPLGSLDPMMRHDLQEDLREVFRQLKKTVVMVTHDMGEACFFADTIVLMRDGHIVQIGSFQDLIEQPANRFVTDFINAQRSPLDERMAGKEP